MRPSWAQFLTETWIPLRKRSDFLIQAHRNYYIFTTRGCFFSEEEGLNRNKDYAETVENNVRSDLPYTKRSGDMVYTSWLD